MANPVVVRCAQVMSGEPVFRGTRVPVGVLFENLADGLSLDEILESYPTLDRDDCLRAIVEAGTLLEAAAPHVDGAEWMRMRAERADLDAVLAILDQVPDVPDDE